MAKIIKYVGIIVGAIIVLLIIAGILLTQLINPNEYKEKISQQVLQHTGHTLQINGDISWSFFPWLGLKVEKVAFGNLPAFGTGNMATVDEAQVRVAVIPLFFGKVSISNLVLQNLQLDLVQDRNGNGNWQMVSANTSTQPATATTTPAASNSGSKYSFAVDNVNVSSGDIHWRNMQTGQDVQLNDIDIQSKHIGFDTPFALAMSANVNGAQPKIKAAVSLSGDFDINSDFSKFSLSDLTAKVNGLTVKGEVAGGKNTNGLNYSGNVSVATFNPKAWLQSMSMPALSTANSKALTSLSGDITFKGSDKGINLDSIKVTLDSSNLTGSLGVQNFSAPAIQFQLVVDQFNMDDYLPQSSSNSNNTSSNSSNAAAAQQPASALPVKTLRQLNVHGNLTVGKLTMMKLQLSNATVGVDAKNGVLSLSPIQANLYQGSTTSNIRYDVTRDTPALNISSKLQQVQIQPLLKDMMNINNISGTANFSTNLNAAGDNPDRLTNSLGGSGSFSLSDGMIQGINIDYQIQRAQALLQKGSPPAQSTGNNTPIGTMSGTFTMKNGIAHNDDLVIKTPATQATGAGDINLAQRNMDYTLTLTATRSNQLQGQQVPFHITGPFSNLSYNLDVAAIVQQIAKQKIQDISKSLGAQGQKLLDNFLQQ